MLLCMPVFLLVYSITGIYGAKNIESFSEELNASISEVQELKTSWNEIDIKSIDKNHAMFSFNEKILKSVEGAYEYYSEFSRKLSSWVNRQSYTVLIISLLNISVVLIVNRRLKRNDAK